MPEYPSESKEGMYQVLYREDGKKLIVLQDLNEEDAIEPTYLQSVLREHYAPIETFYWLLLAGVFVYMTGVHVVIPLLKKFNLI